MIHSCVIGTSLTQIFFKKEEEEEDRRRHNKSDNCLKSTISCTNIDKHRDTPCARKREKAHKLNWFEKPVPTSIISPQKLEQEDTQLLSRLSTNPLSTRCANLASTTLQ